jgi:hypothetical protein
MNLPRIFISNRRIYTAGPTWHGQRYNHRLTDEYTWASKPPALLFPSLLYLILKRLHVLNSRTPLSPPSPPPQGATSRAPSRPPSPPPPLPLGTVARAPSRPPLPPPSGAITRDTSRPCRSRSAPPPVLTTPCAPRPAAAPNHRPKVSPLSSFLFLRYI